ncbi:hypothetical protein M758_9G102700 [Ceratodon purpureus]|uniref:Uncharacterized protein n=1 Tax=Ceratodon purpureus TaxID=3225 RepID=A0A8T0H052_CERPU|nr:hypothetical protein KC19_9G153900 [Ceratodon purpureus]KAG0605970.1 hypothetical protein M758_9G102700 [Ceratodon purpureus]
MQAWLPIKEHLLIRNRLLQSPSSAQCPSWAEFQTFAREGTRASPRLSLKLGPPHCSAPSLQSTVQAPRISHYQAMLHSSSSSPGFDTLQGHVQARGSFCCNPLLVPLLVSNLPGLNRDVVS